MPLVGGSAVADYPVNGPAEGKPRLAIDRSKTAICNTDYIASADLALSGTVHVNDSTVAVSEIDTSGKRIQHCLQGPRADAR